MYSNDDMIGRLVGLPTMPPCEEEKPVRKTWGLVGYPLASVYAPLQEWRDLYDEEKGLAQGTLFSELDKPFLGKGTCV